MPTFIPGIALGQRFYSDLILPLLERTLPGLPHAAALLGPGSEVLGLDTPMSTDHDWAPRVTLFLRPGEAHLAPALRAALERELPPTFLGYPVRVRTSSGGGPAAHRVVVTTVEEEAARCLGWDPAAEPTPAQWLAWPAQTLLELTAGAVYRDDVGALTALRARLAYYPRDVWLYLMASWWRRIAQEEHLCPRAGYTGDDLGARLIAARLVRDAMHLAFLMARRYAPYPKWFGALFRRLPLARDLAPHLEAALAAGDWRTREEALVGAFEALARAHNALGLTDALPAEASAFFDRPFRVIWGDRFAEALVERIADPAVRALAERIADPAVRALAERGLVGGVDTFSDSTDLHRPEWRAGVRRLLEG